LSSWGQDQALRTGLRLWGLGSGVLGRHRKGWACHPHEGWACHHKGWAWHHKGWAWHHKGWAWHPHEGWAWHHRGWACLAGLCM